MKKVIFVWSILALGSLAIAHDVMPVVFDENGRTFSVYAHEGEYLQRDDLTISIYAGRDFCGGVSGNIVLRQIGQNAETLKIVAYKLDDANKECVVDYGFILPAVNQLEVAPPSQAQCEKLQKALVLAENYAQSNPLEPRAECK